MVYGTYNELVIGAFVNQLITRGPDIATISFPKCQIREILDKFDNELTATLPE